MTGTITRDELKAGLDNANTNVRTYAGGIEDWTEAGLPTAHPRPAEPTPAGHGPDTQMPRTEMIKVSGEVLD